MDALRTTAERIRDARDRIARCSAVAASARRVLLREHPTIHVESHLSWLTACSLLRNAIFERRAWEQVIEQVRKGTDVESHLEGA